MSREQNGFTLLEILIGIGITGVMSLAAVGLIFYQLYGTASVKTDVGASQELNNADRWIGQDVMMADETNLTDGGGVENTLILSWTDRYEFSNIPHTCMYSVNNSILYRNYDGILTAEARDISGVEFSINDNILNVTVSCTPETWEAKTVDRTFSVYLRTAEATSLQ